MTSDVQEILKQFNDDLMSIDDISTRIIQLGCFIEVIHMSLNETITRLSKNQLKSEMKGKSLLEFWEGKLNSEKSKINEKVHIIYAIKKLSEVYWARNQCAHDTPVRSSVEKDFEKYKNDFNSGINDLISFLKGWSLSTKHETFERHLVRNAERRPGFVLIDLMSDKFGECTTSLKSQKKVKHFRFIFENYCNEMNISLPPEDSKVLSVESLKEQQRDSLKELCYRSNSASISSSIQHDLLNLLTRYSNDGLWADKDYTQIIRPFIEKYLSIDNNINMKGEHKFTALYIKLDCDDPFSESWPLRIGYLQLLPNIRSAEALIKDINAQQHKPFENKNELAIFLKKKLISPLKKMVSINTANQLVLVIEITPKLSYESLHLGKQRGKKPLESYFKSVLIRLNEDPDEVISLSDHYVDNFLLDGKRSACITTPIDEDIYDAVHGEPEIVLIAENAVKEENRFKLSEAIYTTDIPFILVSLDTDQCSQDLSNSIFRGQSKITMNELFAQVKELRTTAKSDDRKPIILFIDEDELNPQTATTL